MVIHDDDVALQRPPPHLRYEARLIVRTGRSQAGLAARIQTPPQRTIFWNRRQFGAIAMFRGLFPIANGVELVDHIDAGENRLIAQRIQLLPAKVIAAALHVTHPQRTQQRLKKRNVLEEYLLLQIACSGGDNDALAQSQRRQKICQRLAGAGARFHNQMPLFGERALHRARHFQLSGTIFIGQSRARQDAAGREKLFQPG